MGTELANLEFEGATIRVVGTKDEPMWVAADVCRILEITLPANVLRSFRSSEKGMYPIHTPQGGNQDMLVVKEPGLYRLIFKSNKPEAERFRVFLTHDVLPSIRKHGCYPPPEIAVQDSAIIRIDEETLGRAIGKAINPLFDECHKKIDKCEEKIDQQGDKISELTHEVRSMPFYKRNDIKPAVRALHVQVVYRMFAGCCPCCPDRQPVRIINSHGELIAGKGQGDHFYLRSQNDKKRTWIVCTECNSRLRDPDFHSQAERLFSTYQQRREQLERIIQPKLPGFDDVA